MPKPRLIFIIDKDVGMGTCSACAAIFRIEGASKSIKHKLQKKFAKHVSEKHHGRNFRQAVMVAGSGLEDPVRERRYWIQGAYCLSQFSRGQKTTVTPNSQGVSNNFLAGSVEEGY